MLEIVFRSLLRNAILFKQRSTLYTTYYLEWDTKHARATPPKRNWHIQAFRVANIFTAFFILPALWVRCYHLSTSRGGRWYKSTLCLTYIVSFILPCYLCFARFIMGPSGPQKYINCFEVLLNLERTLEGGWKVMPLVVNTCNSWGISPLRDFSMLSYHGGIFMIK